jgi:hypothetical protein
MYKSIRIILIATLASMTMPSSAQSTSKPSGDLGPTVHKTANTRHAAAAPVATANETATADDSTIYDSPALVTRPADSKIVLPVGTAIRMKLTSGISTRDSRTGDVFLGSVSQDVVVEGKTVIPAGSNMNGRITSISEPRRFAGRPSIELTPYWVTLSNGKVLSIAATVVDTGDPQSLKVNDEGRIKGPGLSKRDKVEFVAATTTGTVVGSVVSLGTGTWLGAAAGATFATGHWLIKRHSLELPAGTELVMEISNAVATDSSALPKTAQGGN